MSSTSRERTRARSFDQQVKQKTSKSENMFFCYQRYSICASYMILFPSTWQEAWKFPSRAGKGVFFHSIVWPWNSWQGEFEEWCGCVLSFRQLSMSSPEATLAASPWRWEAAWVAYHSAKSQASSREQQIQGTPAYTLHGHIHLFLFWYKFQFQSSKISKKIAADWHWPPQLMES